MKMSFFCPIFLGHPKARASACKASGSFIGGNPTFFLGRKTRSCRTQELAWSSAQENERKKESNLPDSNRSRHVKRTHVSNYSGKRIKSGVFFEMPPRFK